MICNSFHGLFHNKTLCSIIDFTQKTTIALLILSLSRLYFYLWNTVSFAEASTSEIIWAFIRGIQFDLYSFIILSLPFVIITLFPVKIFTKKTSYYIAKTFYLLSIFTILLFNGIDTEFFKVSGKRSTIDFFTVATTGNETINMIPQFILSYWYHILFIIILIYIAYKLYKPSKCTQHKLKLSNYITNLLALTIIFFLVRGFNLRPLSIIDAAKGNPHTENLVLNTTFTILQTISQDNIKPTNYFPDAIARQLYPMIKHYKADTLNHKKNVVIIIFESFGKEYIGYYNHIPRIQSHTPFLDSLLLQSLTFKYSFANAKRSMEAIPAVLASIPNMSDNPFILSPFTSNRINSIASVLKKHGYHTAFFHGGENGTMNFDKFTALASFDKYYGMNEYPDSLKKKNYDGAWGIYDEPYLQYFANTLSSFHQPFMASLFTLSSHHPYTIPKQYQKRFFDKKGELPIIKTVEYTDMALKHFFEKAKKTKWYHNTIFVLVADHTSLSSHPYYQTRIGLFSILLAYYDPSNPNLKGYSNTITQQIDIFPSIINYLGYEDTIYSPGNSIFSKQDKHVAFGYLSGLYHYINQDYICLFDGRNTQGIFKYKTDSLLKNDLKNSLKLSHSCDTLKAVIQNISNDLYLNKMTPKQ